MGRLEEILGEGFKSISDKFGDVESLAKAYQHLEALNGRSVKRPETDSEMDKFYEQIGVPHSIDGYEGGTEDQRKAAKDLRLTPDQYKRLRSQGKAADNAWSEFVDSTPNYDERAGAAKVAADRLGVELRNDPNLFTALSELGRQMSNDVAPDGSSGNNTLGGSEKARSRLVEIMSSPAWTSRSGDTRVERLALSEEVDTLYRELRQEGIAGPFDRSAEQER